MACIVDAANPCAVEPVRLGDHLRGDVAPLGQLLSGPLLGIPSCNEMAIMSAGSAMSGSTSSTATALRTSRLVKYIRPATEWSRTE
jgi:hypothetical protein